MKIITNHQIIYLSVLNVAKTVNTNLPNTNATCCNDHKYENIIISYISN